MFNRGPGLPGSSPRPPVRNDGYGRAPQQQPPPQAGYGGQPAGYGAPPPNYPPQQRVPVGRPQGGGGGPARQLRPIKSPGGNAYAFGNLYAA